MLSAWIEIVIPLTQSEADTLHWLNPLRKKKCSDYATSVANTEIYRVVFVTSLFFFCESSQTSHPIESDNDKRDRFRLRRHIIEFPPRKSMTCKHINSFINGIFIPFMFFYVSKETAYAGLLDAFASTGSNLKN